MLKTILCTLFFVSSLVRAEEAITSYLASECDTLSLIEGVVNACNGKLIQVDRDIAIQGSDPLELIRHYDGGHHYAKGYGYGVGLGYPLRLTFNTELKVIHVEYRMGAKIRCDVKKVKGSGEKRYKGTVSDRFFKLGYMNNIEAQLMGEPSLASLEVEGTKNGFVVTLGNGTKRHYHLYDHDDDTGYYRLSLEERANGNRRYFHYTHRDNVELQTVLTTNPEGNLVINRIDFNRENGKVTAKGSNGQEVQYQIEEEQGIYLLKKVTGNHIPETNYQAVYHKHHTDAHYSLEKVSTPDGRHLEVDYKFDRPDHNVKRLLISGEDEPLYTFSYHDHHTVVRNALGAEKELTFSKRRLSRVDEEHKRVEYDWDDQGKLHEQVITSSEGTLLSKKNYMYDLRGNIQFVMLNASISKQDAEDQYLIHYSYSQDGRNRLLKESHNHKEKEYHYTYRPHTNLIESKCTLTHGKIVEREFYRYDGNAILICKIADDGSQHDCDNLQDVTYRKITQIEPQLNPNLPGITLPRQITEWYQEPSGQQHLLKRKERAYAYGDLLVEEKVFDSTNTHRYTLVWEYNDKRQLVSETNALGEKSLYSYDANDNQVYEEKVGSGKRIHYVYDAANRLVEESEEHLNNTLTTRYTYDAMGNKTSTTDPYGQITTFKYDNQSREIAKIDPLGNTERKVYDDLDNVSKASRQGWLCHFYEI